MTVNANPPVSGPFTADGTNRNWSFTFKVFDASHLRLLVTDADGSNPVIVSSGFTVASNYLNNDAGGVVVYPIAPTTPVLAGKIVWPYRAVPYVQATKIGNQGGYYPKTHENAFDLLAMQMQQLDDTLSRAAVVPRGAGTTPEQLVGYIAALGEVATEVATVAGIASSVTAVAAIDDQVVLVASHGAAIDTIALNIAEILLVDTRAAQVTVDKAAVTAMADAVAADKITVQNDKTLAAQFAGDAGDSAQEAADTAAALYAYGDFVSRYLGDKTANPTNWNPAAPLTPGVAALIPGLIYYNTVEGEYRTYSGSVWAAGTGNTSDFVRISNNGSEYVVGAATFRGNIDVYSKAEVNAMPGSVASKTTPIDADSWTIWDSAASAWKRVTGTNLKAYLKTHFDTLYAAATRAAIKALDTATVTDVYLTEAGREGRFLWRAGDYTGLIAGDPLEGLYIKATAIAANAGAWVRQRHDLGVDVKWFGALCDNANDDAPAINAAILALPVTGGEVRIPGMCRVTETISIGNGTSSALSTRYGIQLVGTAPAVFAKDGSHPTASASGIRYDGVAGAIVVDVKGPLIGFGVKNLVIDGGGGADNIGLLITSASMGETSDLVFKNCQISYMMTCHSGTTGFEPDISANTDLVRGGNIVVQVPDITGAIGFNFDGAADGSASTCFVNLDTVRVTLSTTHVNYGVAFKVCDGVSIKNILIIANATVPAGTYAVLYDYATNAIFPCGNSLDMIDAGWNIPVAQQFINSGTPSAVAAPNHISNLSEVNGCRYPKGVANLLVDLPQKQASDLALTGRSAAITSTTMFVPKFGTRYRVSWFLPITTAGSGGNILLTFSFKDAAGIARNVTVSTVACNSTANSGQGSILIESSLASPYLNYQIDFSAVTGSPQYSLYVTVERMN